MKRILFITLLFVNLQIVMTEDGLSFISMTASAQDMMYEMLDEIEVEGTKVQCSYCSKRYEPDEMDSHYAVCPCKPTSCPKCGQSVLGSELQSGIHHCYGSENTNDNGNNGVWVGGGSSGGGGGGSGGGIPPGGGSSGGGVYYDTEDTNKSNPAGQYSLKDYIEFAKVTLVMKDLIEQLENKGKIKPSANDVNCHYSPKEQIIFVPETDVFTPGGLIHEMIHYLQDTQNMLDVKICGSDNEYQTYVLNFVFMTAAGETCFTEPRGLDGNNDWEVFRNTVKSEMYCGKENEVVWINECLLYELENLNHEGLSEDFRTYYKMISPQRDVYYKYHNPNYKWNWRNLLLELGVEIKTN